MKATTTLERLRDVVARAEKVTGKNLSLPVLRCVLFVVGDKEIRIRATNLDIGVEFRVPAKVEGEGVIAVPGDVVSTYLAAQTTDRPVEIKEANGNLAITCGTTRVTVKALPHDDFPILPSVSDGTTLTFDAADITRGLRSVWYSASLSSVKPELQSVFIHQHDGAIVFVATDSFRLAEKRVHDKKTNQFRDILLPIKGVPEIVRTTETISERITVIIGQNQISFSGGDNYITSRLMDGTFPDYRQIIPKGFLTEIVVLKQDLLQALKTVNIFSTTFNQITLSAILAKKRFSIESSNADVGEGGVVVPAALSGEEITINFNQRYLADCLQSITSDSVSLLLNGAGKPMVVR